MGCETLFIFPSKIKDHWELINQLEKSQELFSFRTGNAPATTSLQTLFSTKLVAPAP